MKNNTSDIAIRKRTQIAKANKTMFLWIAAASVIVGASIVISIFWVQKLAYNEKVLGAKQTTLGDLEHNNSVVEELENEIRKRDTDTSLAKLKANENDQSLQVILDALPADANSLALGASLQNKLLTGLSSVTIDSLRVDPVIGVELLSDGAVPVDSTTDATNTNAISFQFGIRGSEKDMKLALQNLERSIRTIKVNSVKVEISSDGPIMTVQAQAYYEPSKTIELTEEEVKP